REHGAKPGQDCTRAIADAIKSAVSQGGGRVLIPEGNWLTGPIHLASNIDLHLSRGATLRFSDDPDRYLPAVFVRWAGQECYNYSPLIYARGCTDVGITGNGKVLGNGMRWWAWQKAEQASSQRLYKMALQQTPAEQRVFGNTEYPLRPQFIQFIDCQNILLEDFAIEEAGPFWSVHTAYCHNVLMRRLHINTPTGPNSNGIVIDSTRNVLIESCELNTKDDCISLKSGLNEDGWRVNRPTENVTVRRVRCTGGDGAISFGSEMSGGIRNVRVHDCTCEGVRVGIRMKAARGRGGVVEDVEIRDIAMGVINGDAIHITTEYSTFVSPDGRPPVFRNILIKNITCKQSQAAARMIGLADSALQNVSLEHLKMMCKEGLFCTAGNGIRLIDLEITPSVGPILNVIDSQEVLISGVNGSHEEAVFLDLRGRRTRNIRLCGEERVGQVRPAVVLGVDVPHDAVMHE
ncbi:MAG TPA: glycoside hydrolase family 28 protein, partial [Tepidisphaeraceae bacterium]|nr:glycoside hydrolase family 28 protein [Tepidisphaeraceae bacterium]